MSNNELVHLLLELSLINDRMMGGNLMFADAEYGDPITIRRSDDEKTLIRTMQSACKFVKEQVTERMAQGQ